MNLFVIHQLIQRVKAYFIVTARICVYTIWYRQGRAAFITMAKKKQIGHHDRVVYQRKADIYRPACE